MFQLIHIATHVPKGEQLTRHMGVHMGVLLYYTLIQLALETGYLSGQKQMMGWPLILSVDILTFISIQSLDF